MGVIKQGILGGFSGSVANVVGSSWKGIAVIKAKPLSVANPRTVAQVANRVKFKAGSELASRTLVGIIKPLWDRDAQHMSGFNAWVQTNHNYFDDLGRQIPGTLVISKGNHAKQPITGGEGHIGNFNFHVEWSAATLEGQQLASDKAFILVTRNDKDEYAISSAEVSRSDEEADIALTSAVDTHTVFNVYLAFQSADGFRLFKQDVKEVTAS